MKKHTRIVLFLVLALTVNAYGDSLFRANTTSTKGTLIAKDTRLHLGDIITVVVKESIASSTTSNTNTKKDSTAQSQADAGANGFLVNQTKNGLKLLHPEQLPNWDIAAKNELKASGQTIRDSELKTSISCVITELMSNGLVRIEGEKTVSVNREDCHLKISGLVRVRDVLPDNTVESTQIANAVLDLKGKGPLWNNQRRGLFTRFLDWFSPF